MVEQRTVSKRKYNTSNSENSCNP